jgi:streptomycin 6-kinase
MASITIPPALARTVVEYWAAKGSRWLAELPTLIDEIAADWELRIGPPYALSINWVAEVTRSDGTPAVLKLGVPDVGHLRNEARALRAYDGRCAVRLLAEDIDRGALLLERAVPGDRVASLVPGRDHVATAALIEVGRRLHHVPPDGLELPRLSRERVAFRAHLARFPRDDGPLPRGLVERAAALFDELCSTAGDPVLLHGDLHHDNVLRGTREPWLAIDPFGLIGDRGYEVGAMLYNPDPRRREEGLLALVPARIEQLADGFELPIDRVVAWGFVKGVLSEVWISQATGAVGGRALDVAVSLLPRLP